jgi:hypothetical protein
MSAYLYLVSKKELPEVNINLFDLDKNLIDKEFGNLEIGINSIRNNAMHNNVNSFFAENYVYVINLLNIEKNSVMYKFSKEIFNLLTLQFKWLKNYI